MTSVDATLEHAFLYVRNLDEALAYYQRLLPGWIVRWEGSGGGDARWIHLGPPGDGQPGYLSLCELPDGKRYPERDDALVIAHIGFAHRDVNGLEARLASEGIGPTDRADDGKYRRLYFEDPDGHELEFVQKL